MSESITSVDKKILKLSSPSLLSIEDHIKIHVCHSSSPKEIWFCNISSYLRGLYENQLEYEELNSIIARNDIDNYDENNLTELLMELQKRFEEIEKAYKTYRRSNIDIDRFCPLYWEYLRDKYEYEMLRQKNENNADETNNRNINNNISITDRMKYLMARLESHKQKISNFISGFEYVNI